MSYEFWRWRKTSFSERYFFCGKKWKKPETHPALNTTQKMKFSIEISLTENFIFCVVKRKLQHCSYSEAATGSVLQKRCS